MNYVKKLESLEINNLNLVPKNSNWVNKIYPHWTIGSKGALQALSNFANGPINNYGENRNKPAIDRRHFKVVTSLGIR